MKKILLASLVFLGMMSCTTAQEGNSGGTDSRQGMDVSTLIDSRVTDLTERLSLTSEQVEQVRAIYEKTLASRSAESSEQRHDEIMELLNDDQKEIYSTYLNERGQRTPGRTAPETQL